MQTLTGLQSINQKLQDKLNQALASLTQRPVSITLKDSGLIEIDQVQKWLSSSSQATTTVYIPIMGEVIGDIFVFLPLIDAQMLCDLMIGSKLGTTTILGEYESSALKEMGNITTGVIVTELANALHLSMMLTVPNLATDTTSALVDQVLIEYMETASTLLALEFPFTIAADDHNLTGSFVLFFDQKSYDLIKNKLLELHE